MECVLSILCLHDGNNINYNTIMIIPMKSLLLIILIKTKLYQKYINENKKIGLQMQT